MYKARGLQTGVRDKPSMLLRDPNLSSVFVFSQIVPDSSIQKNFSCEWIADCAKRYKLQGGRIDQLCSYNSQVAFDLGRENVLQMARLFLHGRWRFQEAYAWLLLSDMHTSGYLSAENIRRFQRSQSAAEAAADSDSDLSSNFSTKNSPDGDDSNELPESCSPRSASRNSCSGNRRFDMWDCWAPRISPGFRSTSISYEVPKDAFEDTSDLKMQDEPDDSPKLLIPTLKQNFAALFHELISNRKQESSCRYVVADPSDFVLLISCMLSYYVEEAHDVQMSVTMLIVLGEAGKGVVNESTMKRWFMAYIGLLRRYQLYSVAALVTKLCPIEEVKSDRNQLCTMNILCSHCERPLQGTSNFCAHCDGSAAKCCVCHGHVQSLYLCCPGCLHGGHVAHIEEWFSVHDFCPTGCGHPCEYS